MYICIPVLYKLKIIKRNGVTLVTQKNESRTRFTLKGNIRYKYAFSERMRVTN